MNWDCNTFFHVSTIDWRQRNKIRCIKNTLGEWVTEEEEIKNLILSIYQELFTTGLLYSTLSSDINYFSFCILYDEEKKNLCQPSSEE